LNLLPAVAKFSLLFRWCFPALSQGQTSTFHAVSHQIVLSRQRRAFHPLYQKFGMAQVATSDISDNFFSPSNPDFYAAGVYQPLDPERQEIRLIRISPGSWEDIIECELVNNVSLLAPIVSYKALSYAAGNLRQTTKIKVNGHDFNVFASLGDAMRQLRQSGLQDPIWLDQICINQKDLQERSQQVLQMRSVYSNANKVTAWLGTSADAIAISWAQGLMTMLAYDASMHDGVYNYQGLASWLGDGIARGRFDRELQAVFNLLSLPWWQRCWVCQEIIVANDAELLLGDQSLEWRLFSNFMLLLFGATDYYFASIQRGTTGCSLDGGAFYSGLKLCVEALSLVKLQATWKENQSLPLKELLVVVGRPRLSTDPRDKVFSLLGLADPKYAIFPDYRSSNKAEDVFIGATKAIIETDECLDIISGSNEFNRPQCVRLPTWVPNLSLTYDFRQNTGLSFKASADTTAEMDFLSDGQRRPDRVLHVRGLDLGEVASEETLGRPCQYMDEVELTLDDWEACARKANCQAVYGPTVGSFQDAFAETVSFGLPQDSPSEDTAPSFGPFQVNFTQSQTLAATAMVSCGEWRFFATKNGLMGLAPRATRFDDQICILFGAIQPYILRKLEHGSGFHLVGAAYLQGYMNGEAIEEWRRGQRAATWIDLH
jgi:hypothetical protein